jgi:3-deoxy-D-manno-octulosonate 8-phosphate phosphatase (KDO 8-P phosphatase)
VQPALNFPPELLLRAQGSGLAMKAAIFDVDGVLTDGRLYIGEQGETVKAFSTLDGHGLKLLKLGGIEPLVITGRDSPAVRRRVADLGCSTPSTARTTRPRGAGLAGQPGPAVAGRGGHRRRLARPAPAARAGFACAPANAHMRSQGRGAPRHRAPPAGMARRASSATCC